jgi:hypothetical protein
MYIRPCDLPRKSRSPFWIKRCNNTNTKRQYKNDTCISYVNSITKWPRILLYPVLDAKETLINQICRHTKRLATDDRSFKLLYIKRSIRTTCQHGSSFVACDQVAHYFSSLHILKIEREGHH